MRTPLQLSAFDASESPYHGASQVVMSVTIVLGWKQRVNENWVRLVEVCRACEARA